MPVQGTGADITKQALVLLYRAFSQKYPQAKIVGCIHDEILVEAHISKIQAVAQILQDCMVAAGEEFLNQVPVKADAHIGNSWADKG